MKDTNFIIHEMEIVYQPTKLKSEGENITSSASTFHVLKQLFNPQTICLQEECVIIYLNQASKILGVQKLSKGGINSTTVDIRIILATALKSLATGFIIAHNHPSGKLEPSSADIRVTEKLYEASKLMDIKLVDHIIVTPYTGYFSFVDEGIFS